MLRTKTLCAVVLSTMVLTLVSACASQADSGLSTAEQQRIEAVEFMRPYELSRRDVNFTALGDVVGISCQATMMQPAASQAEALLRLKLAAADIGANRVILKQCQQVSTDGCRASWRCSGDAHQQQPLR